MLTLCWCLRKHKYVNANSTLQHISLYTHSYEESYFETQYFQKYKNGVNTRFLYKIQRRICSSVHSSQNSFLSPPKWVRILQSVSKHNISGQICIKVQLLKVLSEKSFSTSFFSLNKPILQLECMNSGMFLILYSIKNGKHLS